MKNGYSGWIVASVLCSSIAHFALKQGAIRLNLSEGSASAILRLGTNVWLISGAMLHVLALALWVVGLRHVELSVAYPVIALGFVLVALLSWLFLDEALSAMRLIGMLLIASGVTLIART